MGLLPHTALLQCKRDDRCPDLETERITSQGFYDKLFNRVWARIGIDLSERAPREWPQFSLLSEEEQQMLLDWQPTLAPLKAVSDNDVKLAQRLLYYTRVDLRLSDEDKGWHYPPRVTLRREIGGQEHTSQVLKETGQEK